eukprot:PhM_4_TR12485/c0_g1_i2/m.668
MLSRSRMSLVSLNKGAQYPGPTLAGWGRSVQKRRLEYETVESKYGKREFNKNWDLAGAEVRCTDPLQVRIYAGVPGRMLTWCWNYGKWISLSFVPAISPFLVAHLAVVEYDKSIQRAAWW